ncbi:MAG: carbon starvation protein A [Deltaproteobacteria bacterium]|nr:carbon starvation protein A [Deltaproteobacteria bacterium]
MSLALLAILFLTLLFFAYHYYGKRIAKELRLYSQNLTPAHTFRDDIDFVPTKPFYLFGQHFSAIAAAGPIAGPIIACQQFGWLACLFWIGLGVVFIGAVHDFSTLVASLRHEASSVADIARVRISKKAGNAMMIFIWITLIYIIVAFADITASSFVSVIEEIQGIPITFNAGGAVAVASILYLLVALLLGVVQRLWKLPMWLLCITFVPLAFTVSYLGTHVSYFFILKQNQWAFLILVYCACASMLPVWLLLQPRGFLGGFILYFALAVGIIGIFVGDFTIKQPYFRGFSVGGDTGTLFPFLFVTIACGACSGFHGLVCSGTTSKQIDKESHARPIGYGGMLAEAFVAFIALSIVMMMSDADIQGLKPGTIYGNGIGQFLSLIIGKQNLPFAITLGAMAFSTFVFDTLDVATRLGRYIFQELVGWKSGVGALVGTVITVLIPGFIVTSTESGSWVKFWTLFGASNQLLAALSLLGVSMWLYQARRRITFTLIPMLFVLTMTFWALISLFISNLRSSQGFNLSLINALASLTLILLAVFIIGSALRKVMKIRAGPIQ